MVLLRLWDFLRLSCEIAAIPASPVVTPRSLCCCSRGPVPPLRRTGLGQAVVREIVGQGCGGVLPHPQAFYESWDGSQLSFLAHQFEMDVGVEPPIGLCEFYGGASASGTGCTGRREPGFF
mmetsp:Transcript_71922/g.164937  ORF Transcript_71922/g.164937 Transcript_71922/m.164937 type:complete len:121 (-) Transcript_71922:622-984(-)